MSVLDVMSDLGNVGVILGNSPENDFVNHIDNHENEVRSTSAGLTESTDNLGLNSNSRENSLITVETVRVINEALDEEIQGNQSWVKVSDVTCNKHCNNGESVSRVTRLHWRSRKRVEC